MKFKIKKNILLDALNDVSKALSSKNIIPILSGIKFNLTKERRNTRYEKSTKNKRKCKS